MPYKDPKEYAAGQKRSAQKHRDRINSRRRALRKENPDYYLAKSRSYRANNREQERASKNKRKQNRWKVDINFRLKETMRNRVYCAMIGKNKAARTSELLGCSMPYLNIWIELQFQSGMSWDNYGEWHIDHIKPCAKFDLSDPSQQLACFHYTNLQPLWAGDNIRKSDSYVG